MCVDHKTKSLFKIKSLSDYWSNDIKYFKKLSAVVEPFLLTFPSSKLVEAGLSHINTILINQRNTLNLKVHLRPKTYVELK